MANRIELLGDWARVLVMPAGNIVGMSLSYPVNIGRAELIELTDQGYDLSHSEVIRELMDESGTALWGLNLAVTPGAPVIGGMLFLSSSMRSLRMAKGIERGFFASRLPGLARWAAAQLPGADVAELPREQQEVLAERYLHATVQRGGVARTADPLLAMYIDSGAVPVKLVSLWGASRPARGVIDAPSLGYHVLCERRFRRDAARETTARSTLTPPDSPRLAEPPSLPRSNSPSAWARFSPPIRTIAPDASAAAIAERFDGLCRTSIAAGRPRSVGYLYLRATASSGSEGKPARSAQLPGGLRDRARMRSVPTPVHLVQCIVLVTRLDVALRYRGGGSELFRGGECAGLTVGGARGEHGEH
jgi:hypothetical protein